MSEAKEVDSKGLRASASPFVPTKLQPKLKAPTLDQMIDQFFNSDQSNEIVPKIVSALNPSQQHEAFTLLKDTLNIDVAKDMKQLSDKVLAQSKEINNLQMLVKSKDQEIEKLTAQVKKSNRSREK